MIPNRLRATVPGPQPSPLLPPGPSSPFPGVLPAARRAGPVEPRRALPCSSLLCGVGLTGLEVVSPRGGAGSGLTPREVVSPQGSVGSGLTRTGWWPRGVGLGAGSRTRRWCPRSCPGSRRGARARRNCSPAAGGPGAGSASRRSTLGRVRGCAEVSPGLGQAGIRVPSPAEPPTHGSRRVGGRRGNSRPRWAEPCPVWTTVPLAGSGYQEGASMPAHLLIVATHSCPGTDPPQPLWAPQEGRVGCRDSPQDS